MRTKFFAFLLFLSGTTCYVHAQQNIEPRLLYSDTASFLFTSEWQYLSTDIFLFNAQGFNRLINEMDFNDPKLSRRARRKQLAEDQLEYLFVTANLKNVRFFGDSEMVYPLYNFRVQADADARYQLLTSENIEHVRVIDNLPLYSAADHIDAEIHVHAITHNSRDRMLGLVARSLKNIAKLTSPAAVVTGLIGEFGNLLEANTKQKEYRFSSTIRLFEQKNFDVQLHSIKLYAMETIRSDRDPVDSASLRSFLDTVGAGVMSRSMLTSVSPMFTQGRYPLVMVVNYKSVYRMDPVSGDEVTFSTIEKRKLKVENDFRQNLINEDTYRQERDFSSFLTIFANFKSHLDAYRLNNRTGNTDAVAGSLFNIMQQYRGLLKCHLEMQHKYKGMSSYESVFRPEYESVLGFASLYLDDDHNLKATKELVLTMQALGHKPEDLSVEELERAIASLRFSEQFKQEMMKSQTDGREIDAQIERLESILYARVYEKEVERLAATPASYENRHASQALLSLLKNTSCGVCRERSFAEINNFAQRMSELYRADALRRRDSVANLIIPWMYRQADTLQLARANFNAHYAQDTLSERAEYLHERLKEAESQMGRLRDFVGKDPATTKLKEVEHLTAQLIEHRRRAEERIRVVREMDGRLFETKTQSPSEHLDEE